MKESKEHLDEIHQLLLEIDRLRAKNQELSFCLRKIGEEVINDLPAYIAKNGLIETTKTIVSIFKLHKHAMREAARRLAETNYSQDSVIASILTSAEIHARQEEFDSMSDEEKFEWLKRTHPELDIHEMKVSQTLGHACTEFLEYLYSEETDAIKFSWLKARLLEALRTDREEGNISPSLYAFSREALDNLDVSGDKEAAFLDWRKRYSPGLAEIFKKDIDVPNSPMH